MKNPLNNPFKMIRMLRGFWLLSQDPNRLEQVFAIANTGENTKIFEEVAAYVGQDPQGARALREMPRIGAIDLQELQALPEGTLGRVFADHMIANHLDPRAIPVPKIAPGDLRYIKAHLRETHDIWHVATGFTTDVAGEIGLQAFYLAQFPSRLSAILIAMAFIHLATKNMEPKDTLMNEVMRGWALGKKAKPFFGFEWAKHWATPLTEVRAMLGVTDVHEAKIGSRKAYFAPAKSLNKSDSHAAAA
ncbi:MAG: Coq4 family protein [Polyangiaceae bacterium]